MGTLRWALLLSPRKGCVYGIALSRWNQKTRVHTIQVNPYSTSVVFHSVFCSVCCRVCRSVVYIYMCIYMYIYTSVYVSTCIYTYKYIRMYTHANIRTYTHTHTHKQSNTHTHTYTRIYACVHLSRTWCTDIYMYIFAHTHVKPCVWKASYRSNQGEFGQATDTTHCNTLKHIATHCNTLQHTATHCITKAE